MRRACPVCREVSNFVAPSYRFVTGEDKKKVVEGYKERLSQIVCRYYKHDGFCPFSWHCFYRHEKPDGTLLTIEEEKAEERSRRQFDRRMQAWHDDVENLGDGDVQAVFSVFENWRVFQEPQSEDTFVNVLDSLEQLQGEGVDDTDRDSWDDVLSPFEHCE